MLDVSRVGCYRHLATEQAHAARRAEEKRTVSEIHAEHQAPTEPAHPCRAARAGTEDQP
ncbi:hypothetical protein [Streptomyces syringium]|uniref:hypothetical protein n=1 Tax=Streptomyces syringium TaxID=76729 RepID=UPI00345256F7